MYSESYFGPSYDDQPHYVGSKGYDAYYVSFRLRCRILLERIITFIVLLGWRTWLRIFQVRLRHPEHKSLQSTLG